MVNVFLGCEKMLFFLIKREAKRHIIVKSFDNFLISLQSFPGIKKRKDVQF
jgi:hypothetical protein